MDAVAATETNAGNAGSTGQVIAKTKKKSNTTANGHAKSHAAHTSQPEVAKRGPGRPRKEHTVRPRREPLGANSAGSPGVIRPDEVYTMTEAANRIGQGEKTLRLARRRGLLLIPWGKRKYVRGKDLVAYIDRLAAAIEAEQAARHAGN